MSIRTSAALLAALLIGNVAAQDTTTEKGKLSYAIGFEIGSDFIDKKMDVDVATVIRGIQDGVAKRQPAVPVDQMRAAVEKVRQELVGVVQTKMEQAARENKSKSDKFMAENKIKKGIVVLPSGNQYRVIEEGTGKRPLKNSEVTVHYRGSLTSGQELDSSFVRGVPAKFKVDAVLKGWQEILPMMKVGDHWQLFLPPEQAYGLRGNGPIGPNEALVFEIKLIDVK